MLSSYVTGLVAVVGVTLAWVAVQGAWRRAFPEAGSDPDVLAGRMGCHGCTGRDCDGGHCLDDAHSLDGAHKLAEHRPIEHSRIEHNGRIAAVEEIP